MCFNRRRNIFTLGDFNQENNSTSQIRSILKNRTKADLFERDPFKIQSFNFHYAETSSARLFPNTVCPVNSCFNQQTRRLEQQPQRLTVTKPFDNAFHYALANSRQNESFTQASQFAEFRRQQQSSLYPLNSTSAWPGSLQHNNTTPRFTNAPSDTVSQLSTYVGARKENATHSPGASSLHSTRIPKPQYNGNNMSTARPPYSRYFQEQNNLVNETKMAAAARGRSAARDSSKAMAAAVGTVGRGALSATTTSTSTAGAAAANGLWQQKQQLQKGNSKSSISNGGGRSTSRCRRSNIMLENRESESNAQMPKIERGCSATSITKRNSTKLSDRHARQDPQTSLQHSQPKIMVNRAIQSLQCSNSGCQICISIKGLNPGSSNENLIIKIESDAPLRVVSDENENHGHEPKKTSWRSKRLNNLMARKTTSNEPLNLNIRPKRSVDALSNRNQQSSGCSLNQEEKTLQQRRRACERFFEREDERMRQLAARSPTHGLACSLNGVGNVLGRATSRDRIPIRLPWLETDSSRASSVDKETIRSTPSAQQVHCLYERGLKSNEHDRQSSKEHISPSASKPLNRGPSVGENQRLCARLSTSTFTLDQRASKRTLRSASQLSMHSYSSNRSHGSESMQAIRKLSKTTVAQTKVSKEKLA